MVTIQNIMQQPWTYALGWTILHSIWQCASIAVVCAVVLFFTRQATANFRYLVALAGLVSCVFCSAVTFYSYLDISRNITEVVIISLPVLQNDAQYVPFEVMIFLNKYINTLVLMWLVGFAIYTIKILLDYRYCQHVKNNHLTATPEKWKIIFAELSQKVGIKKAVELRISKLISVPCVIGHIKPVVLVPLSLLLHMSQPQIESILLHELGHVRRNDYLLAFAQAIVKTLFFFNPFLIWISNQIDKERENACDDIAVEINQNPLLFAKTLKEFADMNTNLKSAMSINGNKLLLSRIIRLFTKPKKTTNARNSLLAALLIITTGGAVSLYANANSNSNNNVEKTVTVDLPVLPAADAYAQTIAQINQQCGTNVKLDPVKHPDSTRILNMKSMKCSDAIRRVTQTLVIDNTEIKDDEKLANVAITNQPVINAMTEVNKQCGTNETVPEAIRNELASFNFKDMPCKKMIMFIQAYVPN
jgi:beta-lactamase regulating signal transducer with metallopeptidase domain